MARPALPETTVLHALDHGVETFINEIAAEQVVLRLTLQNMLLTLFATRREAAPKALVELKTQVLRSIGRMPESPDDPDGSTRWKRMASSCAEQMFLELEDAVDAAVHSQKAALSN